MPLENGGPIGHNHNSRNYHFLSSFDFTPEGVKLVKSLFEEELEKTSQRANVSYNREKHTFHVQIPQLSSYEKVFIPFLVIINKIIRDHTDPHDPYSEEQLEPNRVLQRITHMKAKKRLPQDDQDTYPTTIKGYSHRHIWHCNDELLRLDYMIPGDCLQRLIAISHGRVAFEKDINEQVIFIGAETQTLLDSMISKLDIIRKCWLVIGDHVPTTVADIVYTENDSSCMASLAPITSTIKVARTTLFDYVKYPRGINHPNHEWLSNRYTVRYCPYHVGRNEYTLQAPTRPKQLAIKCKSQTSTCEDKRLPYIYRGYGQPLPDRSSDLLPEPAEWKPEEPQASARDKVDNWNAGTNAGIVNPNAAHHYDDDSNLEEGFHTRQASEMGVYGTPSLACASSRREVVGQSTQIPPDLLSLADEDCITVLDEPPMEMSVAGDLYGLVFDATQRSCMPGDMTRTDNTTSNIPNAAETTTILVPLSVIDDNLEQKNLHALADSQQSKKLDRRDFTVQDVESDFLTSAVQTHPDVLTSFTRHGQLKTVAIGTNSDHPLAGAGDNKRTIARRARGDQLQSEQQLPVELNEAVAAGLAQEVANSHFDKSNSTHNESMQTAPKSSKSHVTEDIHDRADQASEAIDEDIHSAYSTDDEFFDARQSPAKTRKPLKLVHNLTDKPPLLYESVEGNLIGGNKLAHTRSSSIQPYSHSQANSIDIVESQPVLATQPPSIKEDVDPGTKHYTMRQGSGRGKKRTGSSAIADDASSHSQTMNKGIEQSDGVSIAFDGTVKEASGFADELSNNLQTVINNMRSYDGLCTLEARLGRILVENVNPLQVADDSTARGVPLKMMVDYLQTTEASFTSVLTEKHSEIQNLIDRSANPSWQTTLPERKVTYEIFAASTLHKETFVLEIDAESFEVAVFRQEAFAEINIHCALRNWDFRITAGGKKVLVERYKDFVNEILDSIYVVPGSEDPTLAFEYSGAHDIHIRSVRVHHTTAYRSSNEKSILRSTEVIRMNLSRSMACRNSKTSVDDQRTIDPAATILSIYALPILDHESETPGYPVKWYEVSVSSVFVDTVFRETMKVELGEETSRGEGFSPYFSDIWNPTLELIKHTEFIGFHNENGLQLPIAQDGGAASAKPGPTQHANPTASTHSGKQNTQSKSATIHDAHYW